MRDSSLTWRERRLEVPLTENTDRTEDDERSVCLFVCPSVYLSLCLSLCPSVCLPACLSNWPSFSCFVCLYLSVPPSVFLSDLLSVCLSLYLSVCVQLSVPLYIIVCLTATSSRVSRRHSTAERRVSPVTSRLDLAHPRLTGKP